ncbi:RNA polymerase sigma factor [Mycolicibacterium arenosum]|uniref:RNA polymerase sigma factor n=1 Tax=Mycolicibacterium arenosum TaxID=2952157 RepID=A0ABT1M6G3_9MYCO|nr:RNA polymerase sigma factor [Mycolicibacterium sp. CAU 1645]MCP9274756.1 RNA polymerase sigma factor [Mycolicibacterium sp. CAU 1645]
MKVTTDSELASRFTRDAGPLLDALSRRARRLTTCDADAEDLLQDTLLHAYRGFRSFREGSNLKAWMFRIMHNRWVSAHRYKQCRPAEVAVDDLGEWEPTDGHCVEAGVLESLSDSEVKTALATLPEGVRAVMYYAGVQGYTYAETAALMNIPVGTVMSRVSRGRQRLRVVLAHLDHSADLAA